MLESLCLGTLDPRRRLSRFLLDEHSESPKHRETLFRNNDIDIFSFYEGHSMDLVTFATRVCKLLGVETMIGMMSCQSMNVID